MQANLAKVDQKWFNSSPTKFFEAGVGGGGMRCLQENLWYSMASRLASVFDFITEILFRFLGFGDFKVSIVIEN